ncbi:hypothetical protein [uncultured Megasphaera sp.]|nr:hypothetical protein [uncultured Megasphaera sp.]
MSIRTATAAAMTDDNGMNPSSVFFGDGFFGFTSVVVLRGISS